MKICQFETKTGPLFGEIRADQITPLAASPYGGLQDISSSPDPIAFSDIKLSSPFRPTKIICVGRNYAAHAKEMGNEIPSEPLLFLKANSSLSYHEQAIQLPEQSEQVEHEGELAVVIGRKCKSLTDVDNLGEYILGYTCLNDVTARDIQRSDVQFTRGKSFDTFCPVGTFIETEKDTSDLRITTKVNGKIRQDGRTSQMIFDIPFLVRYISQQMTLNPGDIIATGTPSGVSRLNPGDICEVEIEGIGILRNTVTE